MRAIICGSRDFDDYVFMRDELDRLFEKVDKKKLTILSGAQVTKDPDDPDHKYGADYLAEQWAYSRKVTVERHHADWAKYGKSAGPRRNSEMLEADVSVVIAFWDGTSRGTKDTIEKAKRMELKVKVILC